MMGFDVFEHTADVGVHVTAATLEQLFEDAGRAVSALIIENPDAIELRRAVTITLVADDLDGLFVDWLRELIYQFDTEHLLLREHSIQLSDDYRRLRADCRGEAADWTRHMPDNELKAVTYHQLRIVRTEAGWEADVIFDI
jgi:SHS2 domain-containing protein